MSNYAASERWIHPESNLIIFFPPPTRTLNMKLEAVFEICREWGLGPYWPTMCILVNENKSYTVAFNTNYQPPTYESMKKPWTPTITVFDWPFTFFVEAKSKDHWTRKWGGEIAPHLVDLSVPECSCEDFQRNVLRKEKGGQRGTCSHILAAQEYKNNLVESLKTTQEPE